MWYTISHMKNGIRFIVFALFLFWARPISTAMSGGAFTIYADSFNFTDTASTSGDTFSITDTGGEFAATTTSGGSIVLRGGFQAAERGILSYTLSAGSFSIGPISAAAVSTAGVDITISTDSETGYSLTVTEDGNLRSGSSDINDVSDGSVTTGSEEYGIRTTGTDGLLSSDRAMSGTVTVASATGRVTDRMTSVTFRASADSNTPAGNYSHVVTFTATVNP